jgi:hypothetical protein
LLLKEFLRSLSPLLQRLQSSRIRKVGNLWTIGLLKLPQNKIDLCLVPVLQTECQAKNLSTFLIARAKSLEVFNSKRVVEVERLRVLLALVRIHCPDLYERLFECVKCLISFS